MFFMHTSRIATGLRRTLFSSRAATDTAPANGDTLMHRIANMVLTVTDRQPSKILHIYPEMRMNKFLSDHAIFEVVGLSELPAGNTGRAQQYEEDHYSNVLYSQEPFNPALKTQIRPNAFHVVVCCAPTSFMASSATSSTTSTAAATAVSQPVRFGSALGVGELLRMVASGGHLVLAAPSPEFEQMGYLDDLKCISETTNDIYNSNRTGDSGGRNCIPFRGTLLSIQHVAITDDTLVQANPIQRVDGQYTIALFRKR